MTIIYDVILKRHNNSSRSNVCIFYDEDRDLAIDRMGKYVKENGFTITLRERKSTGEVISETSYHEIFDVVTNKRKAN